MDEVPPSNGWLKNLPEDDRDIVTRSLLDAVSTYRTVGDEQIVSQLAAGYGDARNPEEALVAFRGLASSLRRIEAKYGDVATHIERIVSVMERHFGSG